MAHCVRFIVAGHVQGVFFRATTQRVGAGLGLDGFVRNLADGRVEVLACGEATAVRALQDWLWQGPDRARVDNVEAETVTGVSIPEGFVVR